MALTPDPHPCLDTELAFPKTKSLCCPTKLLLVKCISHVRIGGEQSSLPVVMCAAQLGRSTQTGSKLCKAAMILCCQHRRQAVLQVAQERQEY